MSEENTDNEIIQCVDRGLSVYGPSVKQTVYWQMMVDYNLRLNDVPVNVQAFSKCLESILRAGAIMAERAIAKELIASFDLKWIGEKRIVPIVEYILQKENRAIIELPLNH
ncbi:MAG: hypothetical protein JRN52_00145 [Nitrososphaerota archaeon]|nr:hypothetical protein [Nitrososphaerota archaeon]